MNRVLFVCIAIIGVVLSQSCQPQSVTISPSAERLTTINVENGFTINYVLNEDISRVTVTGGPVTFNEATNTVTVGNPSSSSSPAGKVNPMWAVALFGIIVSLRFPKAGIFALAFFVCAFASFQVGDAQCTKSVTIEVSEDYLHAVRVGTGNTITCPARYSRAYDGQCVSFSANFGLLYASPSNNAACRAILPVSAHIVANSDSIKTNTGDWLDYNYGYMNQLLGTRDITSQVTLADGTIADLLVYQPAGRGRNNFPLQISTSSVQCNATYTCLNGDCMEEFVRDTTDNFWCNSWVPRDPLPTNCSASNDYCGNTNENQTCSSPSSSTMGCASSCSVDSQGQVTCGGCDSRVVACNPYSCECCSMINNAWLIVPSLGGIFVSMFALLF